MPENNSVERAEQRVREMDRVTKQFSEQGNRYMQHMMNVQRTQNERRTHSTQNMRKNENAADGINNIPQTQGQIRGQFGGCGTRFEPVKRKREAPRPEKAEELPKEEEKPVPKNTTQCAGVRNTPNHGIDGEKLLLVALMYLLITENADIKLILAIGYLIL